MIKELENYEIDTILDIWIKNNNKDNRGKK